MAYASTAMCMSLTVIGPGCASGVEIRDAEQLAGIRDQQLAAELTKEATDQMHENPGAAERLLMRALDADRFHGPAHNNLGVLYLNQGKLYEAAEEFDRARRLMPGHPDPRINLGLALELGGKIDDALDAYTSAIELYPSHLPAMQALTRLQLRNGQVHDDASRYLAEIAMRGDGEWSAWARRQLIRN